MLPGEKDKEVEPAPEPGPEALPQPIADSTPSTDAVISAAIVPSTEPVGAEVSVTADPSLPLDEAGKASEPWREEIEKLAKEFNEKVAALESKLPNPTVKPLSRRQSKAEQRTIQIVAKEERKVTEKPARPKRGRTLSFWKR